MRAFGARFRTKTAIADSSHVHWQQKTMHWNAEDLSCGTICFLVRLLKKCQFVKVYQKNDT
jgi:hypothetical protein